MGGHQQCLGSNNSIGCSKSTNAGFSLSTDIYLLPSSYVNCEGLVPWLKDFERSFVWTLVGCAVSIPADKNKLGLLQVGWHGGWCSSMLGGGHGNLHANLILELLVGSDGTY